MAVTTKSDRIDIRLSNEDKALIEKAAIYNRQSISNYIVSVMRKQAQVDIEKNETLVLSNKDRDFILSLLNEPGEPNEELMNLFKWLD